MNIPAHGSQKELSIVIPCLNEEEAVQFCIDQILNTLEKNKLDAEVIFVDNMSTDNSVTIIKNNSHRFADMKLVIEPNSGYGSAYLRGFNESSGAYIFMADCDGTYNFGDIPRFLQALKSGSDLVIGNRFNGDLKKGIMPWHHRYIGNPILSMLVKLFFNVSIHDIHCGARAISREALEKIVLYTRGMEFASEMIIKASKQDLSISEIPIVYSERLGTSKLNSISDGWRHLRFILLYSPLILFLLPGTILFGIGVISMMSLYLFEIKIFGIQLYVHPIFLSALIINMGYQLILFAGFARTYAITHLGDKDSFMEPLYRKITIEKAGFAGIVLSTVGGILYIIILIRWVKSGFGSLNEIKNAVLALTFVTLGIQTFFSAFMFSILGIKEK